MTKQLILDHALALFTDKGYEGASMDDIARAVGIRKASLYAHFHGKESIFSAIFDDILAEYERFIHGLTRLSDETAPAALERVFLSFIDYCYDNPKMYPGFPLRYHYDSGLTPNAENKDACFTVTSLYIGAFPG